jgi:hypothetical protein
MFGSSVLDIAIVLFLGCLLTRLICSVLNDLKRSFYIYASFDMISMKTIGIINTTVIVSEGEVPV